MTTLDLRSWRPAAAQPNGPRIAGSILDIAEDEYVGRHRTSETDRRTTARFSFLRLLYAPRHLLRGPR